MVSIIKNWDYKEKEIIALRGYEVNQIAGNGVSSSTTTKGAPFILNTH